MADRVSAWTLLGTVISSAAGLADEHGEKPAGPAGTGSFIPSATWQEAKPGYYFGRGRQGQGYYRDPKQKQPDANEDGGKQGEAALAHAQPLNPDELLKQAEDEAHIDEIQLLDARGLKRIVTSLEKKYKENLELRMKYPDAPDKFLDSEVDLDEQVKSLLQVAGSLDLCPLLVELNPFPTLMACVGHENTDIAADTLELIRELTDADAVEEFGEEVRGVVGALLEANALELLVQRMGTLNEKVEEEGKALFNCLSIFENLVDIEPPVAEQVLERTKLLKWLLSRMRVREFDPNKQEASELLAVLVQGSELNQERLREANGIDTLLQCVAPYKGRDPATAEEEEFMQNCFDILCAALMTPKGKAAFVASEGVELMWLMLSGKKQSRYGALKLLDYAATRYSPPCEKLVDLGGLKHLFGAFMGKAKIRGPRGERDVEREVEERCVSLIASCLTHLTSKAGRRERVGAKFVESEFEKTDRLMEIFFRYQAKVGDCELSLMEAMEALEEGEEMDEDEVTSARMGAGLFTLQQCALILGHLWALGDVGLRKRVLSSLHIKGQTLASIREVLLEYHASIGDDGGADEAARLLKRVRDALLALGATPEEIAATRPGSDALAAANGKTAAPAAAARAPKQPAGKAAKGSSPVRHKAEAPGKRPGAGDDDDMDMDMEVEEEPRPARPQAIKEEGKGALPTAPPRQAKGRDELNGDDVGTSGSKAPSSKHNADRDGAERDRERRNKRGGESGTDRQPDRSDKDRDRGRAREEEGRDGRAARDGKRDREEPRDRDDGRGNRKEKERERDGKEKERERDGKEKEKERDRDREERERVKSKGERDHKRSRKSRSRSR